MSFPVRSLLLLLLGGATAADSSLILDSDLPPTKVRYHLWPQLKDFFSKSDKWGDLYLKGITWEEWQDGGICPDGYTRVKMRNGQASAARTWVDSLEVVLEHHCGDQQRARLDGLNGGFPEFLTTDDGINWGRVMLGYGNNDGPFEFGHMVYARLTDELMEILATPAIIKERPRLTAYDNLITWEPDQVKGLSCTEADQANFKLLWRRKGFGKVSKLWYDTVPISETELCPDEYTASDEKRQYVDGQWWPLMNPSLPDPVYVPNVNASWTPVNGPAGTPQEPVQTDQTEISAPVQTYQSEPTPVNQMHPANVPHHQKKPTRLINWNCPQAGSFCGFRCWWNGCRHWNCCEVSGCEALGCSLFFWRCEEGSKRVCRNWDQVALNGRN